MGNRIQLRDIRLRDSGFGSWVHGVGFVFKIQGQDFWFRV
jgi:hypothetical protein